MAGASGDPPELITSKTSPLVTLPSLPVPEIFAVSILFSVANFFKELNYDVMINKNGQLCNFYNEVTDKGNFFMIPKTLN